MPLEDITREEFQLYRQAQEIEKGIGEIRSQLVVNYIGTTLAGALTAEAGILAAITAYDGEYGMAVVSGLVGLITAGFCVYGVKIIGRGHERIRRGKKGLEQIGVVSSIKEKIRKGIEGLRETREGIGELPQLYGQAVERKVLIDRIRNSLGEDYKWAIFSGVAATMAGIGIAIATYAGKYEVAILNGMPFLYSAGFFVYEVRRIADKHEQIKRATEELELVIEKVLSTR